LSNSFIFAYLRVTQNGERVDVETASPIFVAGTLCMRIYIEDSGYRGAMLITPTIFEGGIGWTVENSYLNDSSSDSPNLYLNDTKTACVPGIGITYSLYYGRYI
jgi:hypothetical protein